MMLVPLLLAPTAAIATSAVPPPPTDDAGAPAAGDSAWATGEKAAPHALSAEANRDPEVNDVPEGPPVQSRLSLKASVGGYYGGLFAIRTYGGSGGVSVGGGRTDMPVTFYGGLRVDVGRTEHALPVQAYQLTFGPDLALDRVRLGLDGNLGYFRIGVNTARSALDTASIGLGAHASFDFARFSESENLYLMAAFGLDFVESAGPPLWTTTLNLGFRWDSSPAP